MKYVNADTVFSKELLQEIQKYLTVVWSTFQSLKNYM